MGSGMAVVAFFYKKNRFLPHSGKDTRSFILPGRNTTGHFSDALFVLRQLKATLVLEGTRFIRL
ncbi:hypothetical protein L873DRAFT_475088 [Choiromyces venosus 120613-1]|uniref:Uncharacterized protein n=1 Tax=Choiromyces venosus 120613-1 TaxID=1336337 RepID=A0A3N4IWK8_9PEZI|nr:hypothetical protein L873DRAFT_475088 [Choiromyces venosus 120613-1]